MRKAEIKERARMNIKAIIVKIDEMAAMVAEQRMRMQDAPEEMSDEEHEILWRKTISN